MDIDNIQAVIDAAREGSKPTLLSETVGVAHWFVPGHGERPSQITRVDLEAGADAPLRSKGLVTVFDAASFNQVIRDNTDTETMNTTIYFDRNPTKPSVVAVMNGNGTEGPGWGDFRVQIVFRETPQWTKWKHHDGHMLPQVLFAEFLEDNLEDIAEPNGAAMLEIATYLEAVRSVQFKSGIRLSSGAVQFRHEQNDETKVGANMVEVPEVFKLGIRPIQGMPSYEVPARFRWRLTEGKLTLGYKLQRIESLMSQILEDVIAKIEKAANISVLDGLPPEPATSREGANARG